MESYQAFLASKSQANTGDGFAPVFMPDFLFDFQKHLCEWIIRAGRGAIFADCGLGKTPMELVFGQNVVQKTNRPVLIAAPLAVGQQIAREAEKFGIEAHRTSDGTVHPAAINITNYERLHYYRPGDFAGFIGDESSILKSFAGTRRHEITAFMRQMRYRMLSTATAAPNDYIELGTTSEALGHLGYVDMLNRFFKNDLNNSAQGRMRGEVIKWRLKGHAEQPFWRWVCSWSRAVRRPSDIGFDDARFVLPELREPVHLIDTETPAEGMLFSLPAVGVREQREERRRTIRERCEKAAALINATDEPAVAWCDLNDEGDLLEALIPDAVQVSGRDSDAAKEEKLLAFSQGDVRVLVTKQKIAGWGMNWQHCAHMTDFPSYSFEGYYQKVRRFWRFGQTRPVTVDRVTTEGQQSILASQDRKAAQADEMFANLVASMNAQLTIERAHAMTQREEVPSWL